MDKEIFEKYQKAIQISDEVIKFAKPLVKQNSRIFDIAENMEKKIKELGGSPAFPVNISINENAAHYTPDINDSTVLKENQLVKIDVGVHVDGYICDKAFSVFIGEKNHPLIEASEKALQNALKVVKPGVKVFEISDVIASTLEEMKFQPIMNLCGHGLDRYTQHGSPMIPNSKNNIQDELKEGKAYAIEVFVTDGSGLVKETSQILIYRFLQLRSTRMIEARKILERAEKQFNNLPFAKRWLIDIATGTKLDLALRQLVDVNALEEYPVLKEEAKGLVAQSEETVVLN